jgi:bidirectional [NiFe] hydrogenase diaphorase subunit
MSREHAESLIPPVIKTTIDGRDAQVRRDRWALDVAREMGIAIPTLCHHPALEPYGACRMCVVEVTRGKWTWLTTSCDLPIREGLSIRTDTPPVIKARRIALELLWSQAPGSPEIAQMARQMGIEKPRFEDRNPENRCILCGLCVRACEKVIGEAAIGFSRRGVERVVGSPFDGLADQCIGCGACVAVCPTGHIKGVVRDAMQCMDAWHTDLELTRCERCGKPVAATRHLAHIRTKTPPHVPLVAVCPDCRRRETVSEMAKAGTDGVQAVLAARVHGKA